MTARFQLASLSNKALVSMRNTKRTPMIGATLGNLGLSVTANYAYDRLKALAEQNFEGYYSILTLPAETFLQIDSSV
ncbi:MAG: hypothetical protein ABJN38_00050 [Lentilitoribacter sp.]